MPSKLRATCVIIHVVVWLLQGSSYASEIYVCARLCVCLCLFVAKQVLLQHTYMYVCTCIFVPIQFGLCSCRMICVLQRTSCALDEHRISLQVLSSKGCVK